jgi:hypothetical protein
MGVSPKSALFPSLMSCGCHYIKIQFFTFSLKQHHVINAIFNQRHENITF